MRSFAAPASWQDGCGVSGQKEQAHADVAHAKLQACVGTLNDVICPDIVLRVGDLIHGERLDRLAVDMETAAALLEPLRAAFYPTIGNHEIVQREGDPEYERAYRKVFGDDRVSYTFEHDGLRFILLNNGGATSVAAPVIKARNAWLRETLARHRGARLRTPASLPVSTCTATASR